MNLQFIKVTKKSLQQNKVYLPLSHIELTREINVYTLSFPLPLTACKHLPQHTDKTAAPQKLNTITRIKPKQHLRIYEDKYSQLQVLQHSLNIQQKLF